MNIIKKQKSQTTKSVLNNQKGQGLIEYLILVAIVGVATMGIVRAVGTNVKAKYADITDAIGGNERATQARPTVNITEDNVRNSDMSNFMKGAVDSRRNSR